MSALSSRGTSAIADINVTPLVDIVLVLLIIFMVVTEVMADQDRRSAIPVELPQAATAERVDSAPLTVGVGRDGSFVLEGAPAERADVVARVRAALASRGAELEVVVSADSKAAHERFVALLDLLRGEGVRRFAIQTAPVEAERRDG